MNEHLPVEHLEMDLPGDRSYTVSVRVGDPGEVRVELGDITESRYDAIVNAANSDLLPGGGVCGAIHRAGGPAVTEECRRIRSERGPLLPGQAVATTAGMLSAKYVIHTVGPIWRGGNHGEAEVLSSCYRESIRVADDLGLHNMAFPAISTGIFGYPAEKAAWVAIPCAIEQLRTAKWVVYISMMMFDKSTLDAFAAAAMAQRNPLPGTPYEIGIWEIK
jgi:O-acetyl-ADP-ribose deacetylase (regulator of RNase III)